LKESQSLPIVKVDRRQPEDTDRDGTEDLYHSSIQSGNMEAMRSEKRFHFVRHAGETSHTCILEGRAFFT